MKQKLDKKRIESKERNMLWLPKASKEIEIRNSNTYNHGLPINLIT